MDIQEESLLCSNVMLFVDIRRRIKLRSSFLTESMSLDTGCANMCHLCRREGWTGTMHSHLRLPTSKQQPHVFWRTADSRRLNETSPFGWCWRLRWLCWLTLDLWTVWYGFEIQNQMEWQCNCTELHSTFQYTTVRYYRTGLAMHLRFHFELLVFTINYSIW